MEDSSDVMESEDETCIAGMERRLRLLTWLRARRPAHDRLLSTAVVASDSLTSAETGMTKVRPVLGQLRLKTAVHRVCSLAAAQNAEAAASRARCAELRPAIQLAEVQRRMLGRLYANSARKHAEQPKSSAVVLAQALSEAPRPGDLLWVKLRTRMKAGW